jgi:restriction system protein
MRPVLEHLTDGRTHRSREVKEALADRFGLTAEERDQALPSGRQRVMDSRVGWAMTYLNQAGLITRPMRGQVVITDEGRTALATHPDRIDNVALERYPSFREFIDRSRTTLDARPSLAENDSSTGPGAAEPTASTPADMLQQAVATNLAAIQGEVLNVAVHGGGSGRGRSHQRPF